MAVIKVIDEKYYDKKSLQYVIKYATNPEKTNTVFVGSTGTNAHDTNKMIDQMMKVKRGFDKVDGYRQLRHIVVSFDSDENITAEKAYFIAYDIAKFYSNNYQICFGIHLDTDNIHIHFVQNTVNYMNGKLFSGAPGELSEFKRYVNNVIGRYLDENDRKKYFESFIKEE